MNEIDKLISEGKLLCQKVWQDMSLYQLNYSKAIEKFKRVLLLEPENSIALINLGAAYSDTGRHKLALETLLKAKALGVMDKHLYYNIGVAMMNLEEYRENAKEYFDKASKLKENGDTIMAYFDPMGH